MKISFVTEDEAEAKLLLNARAYFSALWEIKEKLRGFDKWDESPPKDWKEVRRLIDEYILPLNLDEIP